MWSVRCLKVKHQNSSKCELFWQIFFFLATPQNQNAVSKVITSTKSWAVNEWRSQTSAKTGQDVDEAGVPKNPGEMVMKNWGLDIELSSTKASYYPKVLISFLRVWMGLSGLWVRPSFPLPMMSWNKDIQTRQAQEMRKMNGTKTRSSEMQVFPWSSEVQPNAFQVKQTKPSKGGCKLEAKNQNCWVFRMKYLEIQWNEVLTSPVALHQEATLQKFSAAEGLLQIRPNRIPSFIVRLRMVMPKNRAENLWNAKHHWKQHKTTIVRKQ